MEYRRFGKTDKKISAITLGGMRFKHTWENPKNEIPSDTMEQCINTLNLAFEHGINHIETAFNYVKSETVFGRALNDELKIPRSSYFLMTKGRADSASEMRRMVEEQLEILKTDYFDFYGWHGINTLEMVNSSCKTGGSVEELLKMKEEGIIKHVGFSTHGYVDTIIEAINTDLFEFVNLHYYYFFQDNLRAIEVAKEKDLGVFIISPNDKGGQLYKAPAKVKNAIPHCTPIQWNARFCLNTPNVHTLSFGLNEPVHFTEMMGIFDSIPSTLEMDLSARHVLDSMVNDDPYAFYSGKGIVNNDSGLEIPLLLLWRKLWKCYDMLDFAKYRYKELRTPNHWVPGVYATKENIEKLDFSSVPEDIPLKDMLTELHSALYQEPKNPNSFNIQPDKLKLDL